MRGVVDGLHFVRTSYDPVSIRDQPSGRWGVNSRPARPLRGQREQPFGQSSEILPRRSPRESLLDFR